MRRGPRRGRGHLRSTISLLPLFAEYPAPSSRRSAHVVVIGRRRRHRGSRPTSASSNSTPLSAAPSQPSWVTRCRTARGRCALLQRRHAGESRGVLYFPPLSVAPLQRLRHGLHLRPLRLRSDLPFVPMFHANAWGLTLRCMMASTTMVMPDQTSRATASSALQEQEGDPHRRRPDHLDRPDPEAQRLRPVPPTSRSSTAAEPYRSLSGAFPRRSASRSCRPGHDGRPAIAMSASSKRVRRGHRRREGQPNRHRRRRPPHLRMRIVDAGTQKLAAHRKTRPPASSRPAAPGSPSSPSAPTSPATSSTPTGYELQNSDVATSAAPATIYRLRRPAQRLSSSPAASGWLSEAGERRRRARYRRWQGHRSSPWPAGGSNGKNMPLGLRACLRTARTPARRRLLETLQDKLTVAGPDDGDLVDGVPQAQRRKGCQEGVADKAAHNEAADSLRTAPAPHVTTPSHFVPQPLQPCVKP